MKKSRTIYTNHSAQAGLLISRYTLICIAGLAAFIPFYLLILIALKTPEGGLSAIRIFPDFAFKLIQVMFKVLILMVDGALRSFCKVIERRSL